MLIVKRLQAGHTVAKVAADLAIDPRTVRKV
jgi:hypothetical protein